jgi:hypothetical protein
MTLMQMAAKKREDELARQRASRQNERQSTTIDSTTTPPTTTTTTSSTTQLSSTSAPERPIPSARVRHETLVASDGNASKRQRLIAETLATERTYAQSLITAVDVCCFCCCY